MSEKVAAGRMPQISVAMEEEDWKDVKLLHRLKYNGLGGFTAVLRVEGMKAIRAELARLKEAQTTTPNQRP